MTRTRALMIVTVLAASLTTASVAVLTTAAHDEEVLALAQAPDDSPGPRTDAPIPMPPRIIGLESGLGIVVVDHRQGVRAGWGRGWLTGGG